MKWDKKKYDSHRYCWYVNAVTNLDEWITGMYATYTIECNLYNIGRLVKYYLKQKACERFKRFEVAFSWSVSADIFWRNKLVGRHCNCIDEISVTPIYNFDVAYAYILDHFSYTLNWYSVGYDDYGPQLTESTEQPDHGINM